MLKKQLAVNVPFLSCGGFLYEEGEGLEEDEVCVVVKPFCCYSMPPQIGSDVLCVFAVVLQALPQLWWLPLRGRGLRGG